MPVAFTCPQCAKQSRVPDQAAGKKIRCPGCQQVVQVPAAGPAPRAASQPVGSQGAAAPAAGGKIDQACPHCNRKLQLPASTSGKKIRCPACQAPFQVGANAAATVAATRDLAAAAPVRSSAGSPSHALDFGESPSSHSPPSDDFDSLFSESDFNVQSVGSAAKKEAGASIDIPLGGDSHVPRPHSFYKVPGIVAIVAASLNILFFITILVLVILLIVAVVAAGAGGIAALLVVPLICTIIWAGVNGYCNVHVIIGGLNCMQRMGRTTVFVAAGELLLQPIFMAAGLWGRGLTPLLIVAAILALYNWPAGIWLILAVGNERAKIDFGDLTKDDLEEQAAELRRRAAGLGAGGH